MREVLWKCVGLKRKKQKQNKSLLASDTFIKKQQAGWGGCNERGNFKRHCLETKNEEKTTSMLYDYPRTGLAR